MGTKYELRNRYLHVQPIREMDPNWNIGIENFTLTANTEQVLALIKTIVGEIEVSVLEGKQGL